MTTASQISERSFYSKMLFLSHIFPLYWNSETFLDFQIFFADILKSSNSDKKKSWLVALLIFVAFEIFKRKELSQSNYKINGLGHFSISTEKWEVLLFRPVSTLRTEVVFPEAKFGALTAFSKLRYSYYKNTVKIK